MKLAKTKWHLEKKSTDIPIVNLYQTIEYQYTSYYKNMGYSHKYTFYILLYWYSSPWTYQWSSISWIFPSSFSLNNRNQCLNPVQKKNLLYYPLFYLSRNFSFKLYFLWLYSNIISIWIFFCFLGYDFYLIMNLPWCFILRISHENI